jgi:hypothetical protein
MPESCLSFEFPEKTGGANGIQRDLEQQCVISCTPQCHFCITGVSVSYHLTFLKLARLVPLTVRNTSESNDMGAPSSVEIREMDELRKSLRT